VLVVVASPHVTLPSKRVIPMVLRVVMIFTASLKKPSLRGQ